MVVADDAVTPPTDTVQRASEIVERLGVPTKITQPPSTQYLMRYIITVFLVFLAWIVHLYQNPEYKGTPVRARLRGVLTSVGVKWKRAGKAAKEIERKTFHLCGLLVPLVYMVLLSNGLATERECALICWAITVCGWTFDICRVKFASVRQLVKASPFGKIFRKEEEAQLTGACFFSLGNTLAVTLFPPAIAVTSLLFLVLGDMSAAIVGVAFGGETVSLKLGRQGKKSAEGSIAMFLVCFVVGCTVFAKVHMREYAVFIGAAVATLTELNEPFGINDNLSIPLASSVAMTWAFARIASCERDADAQELYDEYFATWIG